WWPGPSDEQRGFRVDHGRPRKITDEVMEHSATRSWKTAVAHMAAASFVTSVMAAPSALAKAPVRGQHGNPESPALSGYGGPGAGAQAVLGSELLGTGTHSGPPAAGGTAEVTAEGASESGAGLGQGQAGTPSPSRGKPTSRGTQTRVGSGASGATSTGAPSPTARGRAAGTGEEVAARPLGLSGANIAVIAIVTLVLGLLTALTRRIARAAR
ncbi:MAG: hypothetical protein ACYDA6_07215, partial [Solirubrobacteraceae bacterium]